MRRGAVPGVAAAAVLVTLLALTPLGFVAWVTVDLGWTASAALMLRPRVGELLANTLLLLVVAMPIAAVLAVALAWLTERAALPGARLWSGLMVAPLAVPAFVQAYAWVGLFPGLHGPGAAVLVSVLAYFPFLYLPVAATCGGSTRRWKRWRPRWASPPGACSSELSCRS